MILGTEEDNAAIAQHFARKLAERELIKDGKRFDSPDREEMVLRAISGETVEETEEIVEEEDDKEAIIAKLKEAGVKVDKRKGIDKLKAMLAEVDTKPTEEDFEGLDEASN